MARFRPHAGVSLSLFDTGVRVQGSAGQAQKRRPRCWVMLSSTMIHHREGPLMQQRLSKLEAAQRLGVSPSNLDRMIRRGELEIEREGRGGGTGGTGPRCGSWRLGYPAMHPVADGYGFAHRTRFRIWQQRHPTVYTSGQRRRRSDWRTACTSNSRSCPASGGRVDTGVAGRRWWPFRSEARRE